MVKCAKCGFLAMRHIESRDLREAARTDEGKVNLFPHSVQHFDSRSGKHLPYYERWPICTQGVRNFRQLMPMVYTPGSGSAIGSSEPLYEEIECDLYTAHIAGLTPKDHEERQDRQRRLEEEHRVRQAVWQREDARDKRAEDWHKEQMKELRHQHWRELGILGLAVVGVTIAGAMIEAGWFARPW